MRWRARRLQNRPFRIPVRTSSHCADFELKLRLGKNKKNLIWTGWESDLCQQIRTLLKGTGKHVFYRLIITLVRLQRRRGDPFSLKAQRKRSPCPIKRGTLKPSMLLATETLTRLHSPRWDPLWQTSDGCLQTHTRAESEELKSHVIGPKTDDGISVVFPSFTDGKSLISTFKK